MNAPDMKSKAADILDWMRQNPGSCLEFCRGIRFNGWVWVIPGHHRVHATQARIAMRGLIMDKTNRDWRSNRYILP